MKILETKKLSKRFDGVHAVDNLSLSIEKGQITSIIGPNGSGKTTLLNLLSGMLAPNNGVIVVSESTELSGLKPYEATFYGVSRTFQDVRLFNQMSVLDNLLVVLTERTVVSSLFERHGPYHVKRAQEILEKVNLWDKREKAAGELSYGQRKLLEIARAVATDCQVLLLDEPFAGLFPEMIKLIVAIIQDLKAQGKTIVLIEHNLDLIRELSDHLIVLDSGKLLAEGKPDDVLAQKNVIEAYLGD